MAKKKTEHKRKTFTEAIGLNNIINDKTGFIAGLILLCVAIYICVAFFSYFSTGAADQSLVTDLVLERWKTQIEFSKMYAVHSVQSYHTDLFPAVLVFQPLSFQPSLHFVVSA